MIQTLSQEAYGILCQGNVTTPGRKRYNDDIYFSICMGGPHGFRAVSFGRGRCLQVFLAVKIVIVIDCIYLWLNS